VKQVAYSVKHIGKNTTKKLGSGVACISEDTLIVPQYLTSKKKACLKYFEKLSEFCEEHEDGSFSGMYYELCNFKGKTFTRCFTVWFKEIKD
jgi:hypothetical protein